MTPTPKAVPRYPIATVWELKSVLSPIMDLTLVKLQLNLHEEHHTSHARNAQLQTPLQDQGQTDTSQEHHELVVFK